MQKQNKRIIELDYLRASAFCAVVLQHVLGYFGRQSVTTYQHSILLGLIFGMVKFAVPMFVFLSGMVLFHTYYEKLNYLKFLRKRLVTIFIPFLLFTVFYVLYPNQNIFDITFQWLLNLIPLLIYGSGKYHLWYVAMIFQGFLLLPILIWIFKKIEAWLMNKKRIYVYFFILFFLSLYVVYITYYYQLFGFINQPLIKSFFFKMHSVGFVSYIAYFFLGAVAARYYDQWIMFVNKHKWSITGMMLLAYGYIEIYGIRNSQDFIDLNLYSTLNLRFFVFTVATILFMYWFSLRITNYFVSLDKNIIVKSIIVKSIAFISKYSFFAYLVHAFVLNEVNNFLLNYSLSIPVFYTLLSVFTITISVILGFILWWVYTKIIVLFKTIFS